MRSSSMFIKYLLLLFTLCGVAPLHAATWFVAPAGDDSATGSMEQPFATIQRAQKEAGPGDTVFLRGGDYRMTEAQIAQRKGIFAYLTFLDKSGAPGKPITYRNYMDEKPVFDCSLVKPPGMRVDAFFIAGLRPVAGQMWMARP